MNANYGLPIIEEKPKRAKRDTLFSRVALVNIHTTLTKLAVKWLYSVPMPVPTLDEALAFVMTDHQRAILDEAAVLCPSTISRMPHSTAIIPTPEFDMATMFSLAEKRGRYVPEECALREDHTTMPLMHRIVHYAEHKARVTRNMTEVFHLIEYLNLVCATTRELRLIWPEFAEMLNGFSYKGGTGKDWVPMFQDQFYRSSPSQAPEMFYGAMRYINNAKGYVASAQLALPAEQPPPVEGVDLSIARAWSAPDTKIPWHDEILWESEVVRRNHLSPTMRWLIR